MPLSHHRSTCYQPLIGLCKIMRKAFEGDDLSELHSALTARIERDGCDAAAMLDLSIVLQIRGQAELAMELQWQALQLHQHYRLSRQGQRSELRVLAIMSAGEIMANTPIEFLLDQGPIALDLLFVGSGLPPVHDIPPHDVAFVAVCESDRNQVLLRHLDEVMKYWPKPHLNSPIGISQLSRDCVAQRLKGLSKVVACDATRIDRNSMAQSLPAKMQFPIIARPVDSHAGHGLAKLEHTEDVRKYLLSMDDSEFYVSPFVDYRSSDGLFRKFRIAVVDGVAYPAHMALSPRWMVHYLNADMLENAENRTAESKFMNEFDWEFGARHRDGIQQIDQLLELDYYSLDCSETRDGRLLIFEIDSGAVVHDMDPVSLFPYKPPHMNKLFSAFRGLLIQTARGQRLSVSQPMSPATDQQSGRRVA